MFRRKGDLKQAISWYKRSIAVKPDNSVAHQNLAVAYRIQGDAENTLAEYQWLVRNDPDNPEGYYGLGMTFLDLGQPSAAIKALHSAEELYLANSSPLLEDAQYLLGAAYYDQKDYRNARDYLLLSYPSRTEDPAANYLLGLCYLGPSIKVWQGGVCKDEANCSEFQPDVSVVYGLRAKYSCRRTELGVLP